MRKELSEVDRSRNQLEALRNRVIDRINRKEEIVDKIIKGDAY